MGSVSTKLWPKTFEESRYNTPGQQRSRCHQLANDPRSMTEEISRTPIMVDNVPYSASYLKDLDPRSPAYGFQRTPVLRLDTERVLDPRSPSYNIPRTPLDNAFLEEQEQAERVIEEKENPKISEEKAKPTHQVQVHCTELANDLKEKERIEDQVLSSPQKGKRKPKQLFTGEEFARPRTPLTVNNNLNTSLQMCARRRVALKQMGIIDRGSPIWIAADDKENSPVMLTNM